ncbi:undecaprenyl-phosphate glucose phosphotransferase [Polaribacter pacificus]|uniref:Undecaprenyl-phosphate glucose phosphotransferase n=1 Tax=Polaribacter pacificus TaxID=1775173 RepID=A0A917HVZ3_9FLAO|nr:exopolysaccharide biosynthesis polyprenyl glycosylphosphotransferase [Polaribacter pacificus]GGG93697.1 undecaprenyl-phosphate glucose phosphotransferase [Polaribacter pacificus]
MKTTGKKYSIFIKPLIILFDVLILNSIVYYYSGLAYLNVQFISYMIASWLFIAYYTKFYNVYRYTHVLKLVSLIGAQFFIFILSFYAYFSLFNEGNVANRQLEIVVSIVSVISFFKFLSFFLLKKYRLGGKNYRNVIVLGDNTSAKNIAKLFTQRPDLGYRFLGFFSNKEAKSKKYLGTIEMVFKYLLEETVDEIYCEVSALPQDEFIKIRAFANLHKIEIRLIPETKAIYSKDYILEYYGTLPVLKPKQLPFEKSETHFIKRIFDFLFSLFVCVFILSWALPILYVLVKIDSRGPFLFKQKRDGIQGNQFVCFKIRTMNNGLNSKSTSMSNSDIKITKIGTFLRKTSLDELPQFFNVLKGDMSVVGPRPHILIQTEKYIKEIDNYIVRNSVKPGITGLAQVSGYRGEVLKKEDIKNRVKYDIFYIENWSFLLDVKIIIQTVFNVFRGDEKAY